ncbi:hypothetical protein AOLI_G00267060 [Acnodon oligacanthus]
MQKQTAAPLVASLPDVLSSLNPNFHFLYTLDLTIAFWSVPIHEYSQHKFDFTFEGTQLTWVKTPQGWIEQEHLLLLDELFNLLTEGGLKLNPKKLQLMKREVTFLGNVISGMGCIPDPYKWPLYCLLEEKTAEKDSIVHTDASLAAYAQSNLEIINAPTLKIPDKIKPFILEAAASDTALSAVLLQEWNEELRPVAYASRLMSPVEIAYDSCTRHLLAVHWVVQHFTHVTGFCKIIIHMPIKLLLNGHVTGVHQKPGVSELADGNRRADTAAKTAEKEGQKDLGGLPSYPLSADLECKQPSHTEGG